jgi:hypothetical protein
MTLDVFIPPDYNVDHNLCQANHPLKLKNQSFAEVAVFDGYTWYIIQSVCLLQLAVKSFVD